MSGYLTTHVLDTARGVPAAGMRIDLLHIDADTRRTPLRSMQTNADGRTDSPILPQDEFSPGSYELVFHAGDYMRDTGMTADAGVFLDLIPIRFVMNEAAHFHVPLLLSPYGYSTYRGS
ncbi:hydroxyisourate hydrolase [Brevirhabdus sp.]|uniref:hydroxyisourate hydrolase n=1 Tax=Brevirhabdus sp. TaxID=2004514 RepID=UPI0040584B8D